MEFGLSDDFERYSDITDDELDQIRVMKVYQATHAKAPSPLIWEAGGSLLH